MRKPVILLFVFLFFSALAMAAEKKRVSVKNWHIVSPVARADSVHPDTLSLDFQDNNPIDHYSIANSFNGNLGSPIQSKIYFIRPQNSSFIFGDAYIPYIKKPEDVTYYNTKTPFSDVYANGGGGGTYRAENQVGFVFSANANKKLNFGGTIDYIHAIGEYANQSAKRLNASVFGSYDGPRYSASGAVIFNKLNNYENGGIRNPEDIHGFSKTKDIQTRLNGYSGYGYNAFVYNHHYSLGFNRTIEVSEDSTRIEFIPVTRFAHTIKLSDESKRYLEQTTDTSFYLNTYYSSKHTNDTARLRTISNTFSISIEEEFNKWMQFGLAAYITNDLQYYTIMEDSAQLEQVNKSRTKIGGILSKQRGTRFKYNINAEVDIFGSQIGDLIVDGDLRGFFNLWKDSVALIARGGIRNESPSFFQQHYRSNHFRWDNNKFNRIQRTYVSGTFAIPTRSFKLDVNFENITNYIYYNHLGMPTQDKEEGKNIQILSASLKQDFRVGKFHLDNNVVYQTTFNDDRLPLPELTLYHNLYYLDIWFKVLTVQAGIDLRYNTAYYAPAYMPATGFFHLQDDATKVKIGNYPVMNVYANFHIKQVRFFLKAYHLNSLIMDTDYFSMPNYPINPFVLRLGLSWIFYN